MGFFTFIIAPIVSKIIGNSQVVGKSDLEMTAASAFMKVVCNSQT